MLTVGIHLVGDLRGLEIYAQSLEGVHWVSLSPEDGNQLTFFVPSAVDAEDLAALLNRIAGRSA